VTKADYLRTYLVPKQVGFEYSAAETNTPVNSVTDCGKKCRKSGSGCQVFVVSSKKENSKYQCYLKTGAALNQKPTANYFWTSYVRRGDDRKPGDATTPGTSQTTTTDSSGGSKNVAMSTVMTNPQEKPNGVKLGQDTTFISV